ncbi:MAG: hypothetical protein ACLTT1_09765 [[Clostridium] scindens]
MKHMDAAKGESEKIDVPGWRKNYHYLFPSDILYHDSGSCGILLCIRGLDRFETERRCWLIFEEKSCRRHSDVFNYELSCEYDVY